MQHRKSRLIILKSKANLPVLYFFYSCSMSNIRIIPFYCIMFPGLAPDDAKAFSEQTLKMHLKENVYICMCSVIN